MHETSPTLPFRKMYGIVGEWINRLHQDLNKPLYRKELDILYPQGDIDESCTCNTNQNPMTCMYHTYNC